MLTRYTDRIRAQEREQLASTIERIRAELTSANMASAPLGAITWDLPEHQFDTAVLELIRQDDKVAIKKLSFDLAAVGRRLATQRGAAETIEQLLDRAASTVGLAIVYGQAAHLRPAVDTLHQIYLAGEQLPDDAARAVHWRDIAARVLAALGLAVRQLHWSALETLVHRSVPPFYHSWLRHALTMANRADVLVNDNGKEFGGEFLSFARWHAERIPALHLDVGPPDTGFEPGAQPSPLDPLLDSICQADLLACVGLQLKDANYYPSFGEYFARRTRPIADSLARDTDLRAALGASSKDEVGQALSVVVKAIGPPNAFMFDHDEWPEYLQPLGLWAP